ncbi:hypothetical protein Hanom_Chr12g01076301 [Helianthus anomalus]
MKYLINHFKPKPNKPLFSSHISNSTSQTISITQINQLSTLLPLDFVTISTQGCILYKRCALYDSTMDR